MNTYSKVNGKKFRFYFHYNKPKSKLTDRCVLTLHFHDGCHTVNALEIETPTETHEQLSQPKCIVRGWAKKITIETSIVDNKQITTGKIQ